MKKSFGVLCFMMMSLFLMSQGKSLIKPIVESPPMDKKQVKAFKAFQEFRNWGIERTGLDSIINQGYRGKGTKVCICDTGKPTHSGLKGRVSSWANFTGDPTSTDRNGHSTHVGGIINEIAPDARLYFAKVLSNDGWGSDRGIADGILWCKMQGVDVINLSLGGPDPSPEIKAAIDSCVKDTILFVAAVGNEGDVGEEFDMVGYPAKYSEVLAVGSINYDFGVSFFSSAGSGGDVVAPGSSIVSMWLDNQYIALSGTSMATPFVAASGALYIEKYGKDEFAEEMIKRTAKDISPEGYDRNTFWGKLEPKETFSLPTIEEIFPEEESEVGEGDKPIEGDTIPNIESPKEDSLVSPEEEIPESFEEMKPSEIKWVLIAMGVVLLFWLIWVSSGLFTRK